MSMRLMKTLLSCNVIQRKKWEKLRHGFLLQLCCSLCILRDLWFIFAMIIIINVIGVLGSSVEEGGEYPSDPGGKVTPLCKRLGLRWNTVQCETLWNTVQCRFGSDFLASSHTLLLSLHHHRLLMTFLPNLCHILWRLREIIHCAGAFVIPGTLTPPHWQLLFLDGCTNFSQIGGSTYIFSSCQFSKAWFWLIPIIAQFMALNSREKKLYDSGICVFIAVARVE